jgi:hypothetical protein
LTLSSKLLYLDSSAIVKLVAYEPETIALLSYLGAHPQRVSSALARVETLRAIRRAGGGRPDRRRAEEVLSRIALIRIDEEILEKAAELEPPDLRTLDAIHLATALTIRHDLAGLISYDERFSAAATSLGLTTASPR